MARLAEWLVGVLFGMGLLLSGMTDPGKVLGFLDLAGSWDPSLMLVMIGAVVISAMAFMIARRRTQSVLGDVMRFPVAQQIDAPLVVGSVLFGVGWGLAGFCPGPALVSMAAGQPKALLFVSAMLVGMALFELLQYLRARAPRSDRSAG